jgi:hypothetical protein
MEYFHVICVREFSIFFELPAWDNIILQGTLTEPALHHAALAIGALTRSRYYPDLCRSRPAIVFSVQQYSMAIQDLHRRLAGSPQSLELAVLASIVFSYIEFLLGVDSKLEMHMQAGRAILENLYMCNNRTPAVSTQVGSKWLVGNSSTTYDLLASVMSQLTAQVNLFERLRSNCIS